MNDYKRADKAIKGFGDFYALFLKIVRLANRGISRHNFLRDLFKMLIRFSECDSLGFRIESSGHVSLWEVESSVEKDLYFKKSDNELEGSQFYLALVQGHFDPFKSCFTRNGSFWTGDTSLPVIFTSKKDRTIKSYHLAFGDCKSLLIIPFEIENETKGLLMFKSKKPAFFKKEDIELYEWVAQTVGFALMDQRAQSALRERVKELSCLYGISQIVRRPGITLEEIFERIVEILPPAFQYPEIAAARIHFDDRYYQSSGFKESCFSLISNITVNNVLRGFVEVFYLAQRFEFEENPFLEEEQNLIDGIAKQISLIVEGRKAEEDKKKLEVQLRHADRLATIGELAAGVAHELNEPLGNILGFAQLARKSPELLEKTGKDLERIIQASLHAREVVKKLLIFARLVPARKSRVNLNRIVEDGLYFLEFRFAKEGIELERFLDPDLPDIIADPGQLNQVLVNLVVNSIQAMPGGGTLVVKTKAYSDHVELTVEDNGIGMNAEVKSQIFLPFYTTKSIEQGTGLGLAVVHGIVTSHGGKIEVDSKEGEGSRFTIKLPVSDVQDSGGASITHNFDFIQ